MGGEARTNHVHELGSPCPISVDVTTRIDSCEGDMCGRDRADRQRHVYRLAKTNIYLQLIVLCLILVALSMVPMAEARLVGGGG